MAGDPALWKNIRRGNTILEIYDPEDYNKLTKVVIGRKGMNKFFNLPPSLVSKETRHKEDILDKQSSKVKNYIMAPIKKALEEGH